MRLRRILGTVLVVGLVAAPAFAQVTEDDLAAAELEVATTRAELEALAVELESATVRSIIPSWPSTSARRPRGFTLPTRPD